LEGAETLAGRREVGPNGRPATETPGRRALFTDAGPATALSPGLSRMIRAAVLPKNASRMLALLDREADRLDEDGIAGLDGDVVSARLHVGNFDYNFVRFLGDDGGFVVVLVVGEENRGHFALPEIFSCDGDDIVRFAAGWINARDANDVLRQGHWDRQSDEDYRCQQESSDALSMTS
jgi:hypothetical protein